MRILVRIGINCTSVQVILIQNTENAYQVFGTIAEDLTVFYANIDTKYNSSTSNISCHFLIFNFRFFLNNS